MTNHTENLGGMILRTLKTSKYMDPRGIRVECQYCGAEYLIEDRDDWAGDYVHCITNNDKYISVYEYKSKCPGCGAYIYHGIDYRTGAPCIRYPMFERADWLARFSLDSITAKE